MLPSSYSGEFYANHQHQQQVNNVVPYEECIGTPEEVVISKKQKTEKMQVKKAKKVDLVVEKCHDDAAYDEE